MFTLTANGAFKALAHRSLTALTGRQMKSKMIVFRSRHMFMLPSNSMCLKQCGSKASVRILASFCNGGVDESWMGSWDLAGS